MIPFPCSRRTQRIEPQTMSNKTTIRARIAASALLLAALFAPLGCSGPPPAADAAPKSSQSPDSLQWDQDLPEPQTPSVRPGAAATARLPPKRFAPEQPAGEPAAPSAQAPVRPARPTTTPPVAPVPAPVDEPAESTQDADGETWAIVLQTFSQADHAARAEAAVKAIASRWPPLRQAYVRQIGGGSAVLLGAFTGPTDARAKSQLDEVKKLVDGRARPFAMAMLTRYETNAGAMGTFDLRRVRERYPNQNPLYSVQVAVWSDLGSGELSLGEVKRHAESYCKQLRTRGVEAYVFHDGGTKTSSVCVGVFGRDAYDPRSTLYSAEVEAVLRRFPQHLVNGEPLMLPYDKSDPTKLRAQPPTLVEVPK